MDEYEAWKERKDQDVPDIEDVGACDDGDGADLDLVVGERTDDEDKDEEESAGGTAHASAAQRMLRSGRSSTEAEMMSLSEADLRKLFRAGDEER